MSFEKAVEYLERLGVEFNQDYDYGKQGTEERHRFDVKVLTNIRLPFTAEEWCDLCMHEGDDYIGGCCGTTSAAQDAVNHVFREGGWIDGKELDEIGQLMSSHDEDPDSAFNFVKLAQPLDEAVQHAWDRWTEINPWEKLSLLWHITRDHFRPDVPRAKGKHLSELEAALGTLANGLRYLDAERLFSTFSRRNVEENYEESAHDKASESQSTAIRLTVLAKILPALKVVNEQIHQLNPGPFEGFALIDKTEGPDALAENALGPCLYRTQEDVDHILGIWREQEKEYEERNERVKPIDERIAVRRVRVTVEKGIEFLD